MERVEEVLQELEEAASSRQDIVSPDSGELAPAGTGHPVTFVVHVVA